MAEPLRVVVLGMAHDHLWGNLKDLVAHPGATVVGGADPNPKLRGLFHDSTGCERLYEDAAACLDETTPDAAFVFSPTALHVPIVEQCAARGVHVLVEKPMAATLAGADRMLGAARRAGIRLMVNWPTAWRPANTTALRLVREGRLGRIWQFTWRGGHAGPEELGCSPEFCQFLFDRQLNGSGAFTDYCGYGAGLCLLFLGAPPNSVMGMAGRLVKTRHEVEDNGILLLRYPGALCRLEMTWTEAVALRPPHDAVLYGTEATLTVGAELRLYTPARADGEPLPLDPLPEERCNATGHFLHCIRADCEPADQLSPDLSRAAQEIIEAGLRSATGGAEVHLPLEDHLFRPT